MSSYSDLATSIINKNGQGGKFSGLNTALDLRQAFKDAATQYAYQQQLAQQQGRNSGYASIINSANINGIDPSSGLIQFNQAINNNGVLPTNNGAATLAAGNTPTPTSDHIVESDPNNPNRIISKGLPTPPVSDKNEAYLNNSNLTPERKNLIKNISNYQGDPAQLYRGNAGRVLASQVASYDPSFDAATYKERQQFITGTWDKGELSKDRKAIENLTQHSAKLSDAFDMLNNGNLLIQNAGTNELKRQTGNAQVVKAAQLERVAGTEMAKTLNTAGVLTDEAMKQNMSDLQNAASPDQMHTIIHGMMVIAQPRINSTLERYKERMGKYPQFGFTPEATNAIKKIAPDVYNELAPKLGLQPVTDTGQRDQGGQTNTGYTEGQTATNPQTGHTVTYRGGKWQ